VVDWASLWPQLGALAQVAPLAATQVLERDGFRELGTVVAPLGQAPDGARCLDVTLLHRDGRVSEYEVPAGTVARIPLGLNEEATLEVRPARQFDIGLGIKGLGGKTEVRGGSLGVLVDTAAARCLARRRRRTATPECASGWLTWEMRSTVHETRFSPLTRSSAAAFAAPVRCGCASVIGCSRQSWPRPVSMARCA
jgi:hypothetical protein